MKKAMWKGYSNMVVRFYKHLKMFLKNSDIKAMFPLNIKSIRFDYMHFLLFYKRESFEKIFQKIKKKSNFEEIKVLEQKKNILGESLVNLLRYFIHNF